MGKAPAIQTFSQFADSVSLALASPKLCGDREYSLAGAPSFVKLTVPADQWASPLTIEVQTNDKSKAGRYNFELKAKLVSYATVAPAVATLLVLVEAANANKKPYFATTLPSPLTV